MTGWSFYALGDPKPQGSKKHVGNGRMVEQVAGLGPWRDTVATAAFGKGACLDGPLLVVMAFTLRRPTSARKSDRRPSKTPDLSKLARSTEDSITTAGLWADDARVAEYARLAKTWPGETLSLPVPGVIVACVAEAWDHEELAGLFDRARNEAWAKSGVGRAPAGTAAAGALELAL